jgi:HEAT repeat protein
MVGGDFARDMLSTDPDENVRAAALTSLAYPSGMKRSDAEPVVRAARALLESPNPDIREKAAYEYPYWMTTEDDVRFMLEMMANDPEPRVRIAFMEAMNPYETAVSHTFSQRVSDVFVRAMTTDPDQSVRLAALWQADIRDDRVFDSVARILQNRQEPYDIRFAAAGRLEDSGRVLEDSLRIALDAFYDEDRSPGDGAEGQE